LEQFVEPLRQTCTLKVKPNSVKQEYEKQDELKRSALRATAALLQIPKAGEFFFAIFISKNFDFNI
jgi:cullin-associated NEDD8-dissociated protein 1